MKALLGMLVLALTFVSIQASAMSFTCTLKNGGKELKVLVYGENGPDNRSAAVMVLSNPSEKRSKTIAVVKDTDDAEILKGNIADASFSVLKADAEDMIKWDADEDQLLGRTIKNLGTIHFQVPNFDWSGARSGTSYNGELSATGSSKTAALTCVYRKKNK